MIERFESAKERFNNIFQETRNECENILKEVLTDNSECGNIDGVTCNAPNYDNEFDEPFCFIDKVVLEDCSDSEEMVVILEDDSRSYKLELDDITIEQLLLITEMVLKNTKKIK